MGTSCRRSARLCAVTTISSSPRRLGRCAGSVRRRRDSRGLGSGQNEHKGNEAINLSHGVSCIGHYAAALIILMVV